MCPLAIQKTGGSWVRFLTEVPSFLSDISTGSLSEVSFKLFISTYDVK